MESLCRHLDHCRGVNGNLPAQHPSECVLCSCPLAKRRQSIFLQLDARRDHWYVMQFTAEQKVAKSGKRGENGQPTFCLKLKGSFWAYKMQFVSGDFGWKGVMSKDLYVSFTWTNHTHPGCVKEASLAQMQFLPSTPTYPHLPTTKTFSLKRSLNEVSWQL